MKKRIRTNRLHRYILASGLIMVSFGIWISCSKDAGISSINPTDDSVSSRRLVGTKPAVGGSNYADFHPQTNVNYNPYDGRSLDDIKVAIGGMSGAEKYLQVIARQVAQAMNDKDARSILHRVVPKWDEGEINLAQVAIEHPEFLKSLSVGFKSTILDKAVGADLSTIIQNTESDSEAILKASKALFDIVLTLVTPDGVTWDSSQKIPVFYMPIDDELATVMVGVDDSLNVITFPIPDDGKAPYSFVLLNFDESLPLLYEGSNQATLLGLSEWFRIWISSLSLTSTAHADDPYIQDPCYHEDLLQPVRAITIYNTHENWSAPEIAVGLNWPSDPNPPIQGEVGGPWYEELPDVDTTHNRYTNYAGLRTTHGVCDEYLYKVFVEERDYIESDNLARWFTVTLPGPTTSLILYEPGEVRLEMRQTTEDR